MTPINKSSMVPTAAKPTIRPSTTSLARTGLVTIVCRVRLLMSAGMLRELRKIASNRTR